MKIKTGIEDSPTLTAPFTHWSDILPRKSEWAEMAFTPAEQAREAEMFQAGVKDGGLGLGVLYAYLPGLKRDELYGLMGVAGRLHAPLFIHARASEQADADHHMPPIQELVADAAATGAPVHICHIGSTGLAAVPQLLDMIDGARFRGVDVTTEVYPYDAGSTAIGSAIFNPGWQSRLGADYKDIEWPPTGERLTASRFDELRAGSPGVAVIIHTIPEASVKAAIADPGVIIASDAVPYVDGAGHPRGSGTFARVLGVYVREGHSLSLMQALGKMTFLPARRLETIAPAMRLRGCVHVGADADLTLFDPGKVADRATYAHPTLTSVGIPYVIVGGVPVVAAGEIVKSAYPGRGVKSGS